MLVFAGRVREGVLNSGSVKMLSSGEIRMVSASRASTLSYWVNCHRRSLARTSRKREREMEEAVALKLAGRSRGWIRMMLAP